MIYFVQSPEGGPIKIGTSVRLSLRLKQLIFEHKSPLVVLAVVPGGYADEQALHRRFSDDQIKGEWFNPSKKLLRLIKEDGRPWDGKDEASNLVTVKMDTEVVHRAKIVAAFRRIKLHEFLSETLASIIEERLETEHQLFLKRNSGNAN